MKWGMTGPAALLIGVLPCLPSGPLTACEVNSVLVDSDCISAEALNVSSSGAGVSVGGIRVSSGGGDCPALQGAGITYYRDKDGRPGFADPPDQFVGHIQGELATSTGTIEIGTFSSHDPNNGPADSWQLVVTDAAGGTSTFSGEF